MKTREEITQILRQVIASEFDPFMTMNGFARHKGSTEYIRQCRDSKQLLRIDTIIGPTYQPGAIAHIYPWIVLNFPKVNLIASEMICSKSDLVETPDITISQPMDIVIPKECQVKWFIYQQQEDVWLCVRSIQGYVEKWVIPFFNDYTTIESLAVCYEKKDERVLKQRNFYLYVTAVYVALNKPTKAMQILETIFGKPALRQQYAKAFEHVSSLLAK